MTDDMQESDQAEGFEYSSPRADSDYESSTDGQRPGRFYGPDSSWRYYTQDERALAASLQQSENNDLSHALFNVHAMKARARGLEAISAAEPWHSKARWIQADQDGKIPFQPPPKWTAWPLKPDLVPRTREVWGGSAPHPDGDPETYSKPEPWKPSLNLQEELKAVCLRQAKDRFNLKQWEDGSLRATQSNPAASSQGSPSILDDELVSANGENTEASPGHARSEPASATPLFLADDDIASTILQPTVRHIISRQDGLLAALCRSRQGHRMDHAFTTRAKRNLLSGSISKAQSSGETKPARKRKRIASDAVQADANVREDRGPDETVTEHPRKTRGQYRRFPAQRDWSEVLGIAAMAGWEPSTIDRAARRCAAIFGESMSMRSMAEIGKTKTQDRVVKCNPDMTHSANPPVETQTEEPLGVDSNACPHPSCRRHYEPYVKCWRLREHLKRAHEYSTARLMEWTSIQSGRGKATMAPGDETDSGGMGDIDMSIDGVRDDFLQPIIVSIGRSRDKRTRASRSRSRSAAVKPRSGHEAVGSGSAMSEESEIQF